MAELVQSGSVFFGRSEGAQLGYAVSVAGDVDGDGWADLIFGAPNASVRDPGGSLLSIFAGEAVLLRGGPDGFAPVVRLAASAGDPRVTVFEGSQAQGHVGAAVAGGGDIDGDGLDDLLIGAPFRDHDTGQDAGSAFAVFGGTGALAGWSSGAPGTGSVSQELPGGTLRSYAGFAVAMLGDIDGDGRADSAIGLPGASLGTRFGAGIVELRLGGSGDRDIDMTGGGGRLAIVGGAALDAAGAAISAAGDFNGDGVADLLIGAPMARGAATQSGAAYVVFGARGGWQADIDLGTLAAGQGVVLRGAVAGDLAGVAVAAAGDVNGDGIDDVLIGIPRAAAPGRIAPGGAMLLFGSAEGPGTGLTPASLAAGQGYVFLGAGSFDAAGITVAAAGDINGDGWSDLLIGADLANDGTRVDAGAVYLVHGGPGVLAALDALDGAADGRIELARVGAAVSVETAYLQAPAATAPQPPSAEVNNDPATTPELRGPYEMLAANVIPHPEARALLAQKAAPGAAAPSAGNPWGHVMAGDGATAIGQAGGETGDEFGGVTGSETGSETGGETGSEIGEEIGGEAGATAIGQSAGAAGGDVDDESGGESGGEVGGEVDGEVGGENAPGLAFGSAAALRARLAEHFEFLGDGVRADARAPLAALAGPFAGWAARDAAAGGVDGPGLDDAFADGRAAQLPDGPGAEPPHAGADWHLA